MWDGCYLSRRRATTPVSLTLVTETDLSRTLFILAATMLLLMLPLCRVYLIALILSFLRSNAVHVLFCRARITFTAVVHLLV